MLCRSVIFDYSNNADKFIDFRNLFIVLLLHYLTFRAFIQQIESQILKSNDWRNCLEENV